MPINATILSVKKCALLFCPLLFLCIVKDYAQLALGAGFEYGLPVFVNKQVFVKTTSLGIGAVLSYCPPRSRVFPSVTYLIKSNHVPVGSQYYNTFDDYATYHNFALNLNYRTTEETHYSLFFIGIGIAGIKPGSGLEDSHGNALTLIDTGNIKIYPLVQGGVRYMHKILQNGNFYLGLEANIKYIRMHSDNAYYIQQGATISKATINGDIIFPGIQVQLIYFFERAAEY